MSEIFDVVIIGSGPAGFSAAIRASQLGKKAVVIEENFLGGVCLNRGCIPTKAMLLASQKYSELKTLAKYGITVENSSFDFSKMLEFRCQTTEKIRKSLEINLKNRNIQIINAKANLNKNNEVILDNGEKINYKYLIIATGSVSKEIPNIGFSDFVLNSDGMLCLDKLPERILIVGSGAIGLEWARILAALNKKVYLTEMAENIAPFADITVSKQIERILKKQRIEIFTSTSIQEIQAQKVTLTNGKEIEIDKILVAIGRKANLTGLENSNLEFERGFIKTDNIFRTNIQNIYAIGDITGKQLLAHTAATQAVALINNLFENKPININYKNIPYVIYGKPEIASVGLTEKEIEGNDYKVSNLPLTISAKAYIDGEVDGLVKVLSKEDKIMGASIIANDASALLMPFVQAITLNTSINEMEKIVYPHPTTTEAISESILNLAEKAFYVIKKD